MREHFDKLHEYLSQPENRREGYILSIINKIGFGSRALYTFDDYNKKTKNGDKFDIVLDWQAKSIAIKWSRFFLGASTIETFFTEYPEFVVSGSYLVIAALTNKKNEKI